MEKRETKGENQNDEVPAVVPSHRSTESWTQASRIHSSIGEMPKAEEGNRTESGKIEHVQSNVASANKWCKCRQVATEGQCGQRDEMRLKIACADKCGIGCMFGKMWQITWRVKRQWKSGH